GFAPMVTQLLAINPERQNSFLGTSPFDRTKDGGIGWANNTLFLLDANGKASYLDLHDKQNVHIRNLWHAIHLTHIAELNGKMAFPD
ncbi:MAG: hypothetical protein KAI39_04255, partial [Desulfobulbaceae bacterium]|nr:hypothetical protein [Desulfobulbaceae bacterium]